MDIAGIEPVEHAGNYWFWNWLFKLDIKDKQPVLKLVSRTGYRLEKTGLSQVGYGSLLL